jgi:type IV pilus assembly protein PilW
VNKLDDLLVLAGENSETKELDKRRKTNWKKIVAIKVGLLIRGMEKSRADTLTSQYDLFGVGYGNAAAVDIGTVIKEEKLQASVRNRLRKVFQQTIILRNLSVGSKA